MTIDHALSVEGFMSHCELEYIAHIALKSKFVIEVGSWKGRSACAFAANTPGILFCVDTWQGRLENDVRVESEESEFMSDFTRNTMRYGNIIPIRKPSLEAAAFFGPWMRFDAIFIDAGHSYDACKSDILAWKPLLKPGGILFGHDYGHDDWPGVKQAVDELIPDRRIIEGTSIWTTEAL